MNTELAMTLVAVMQYLYAGPHRQARRSDLCKLNGHLKPDLIDHAIEKAKRADLLLHLPDDSLCQTGPGLEAFLTQTFIPLSLGREYLVGYSTPAMVHLIVSGTKKKETGATGFYCADVGGQIVTAAHNVSGRTILRIEDAAGNVLHHPPLASGPLVRGLDLAIVNAVAPDHATKLRIEWDKNQITPLRPLYVFGFPQVPQHTISLVSRSGELCSISGDYTRRQSYLIPRVTHEGFSGGPALNERGRVVGVVQGRPHDPGSTEEASVQNHRVALTAWFKSKLSELWARARRRGKSQSMAVDKQEYDTEYSVLTPAWYLAELPGVEGPRESPITGGFL